jgi:hypothetical protein
MLAKIVDTIFNAQFFFSKKQTKNYYYYYYYFLIGVAGGGVQDLGQGGGGGAGAGDQHPTNTLWPCMRKQQPILRGKTKNMLFAAQCTTTMHNHTLWFAVKL